VAISGVRISGIFRFCGSHVVTGRSSKMLGRRAMMITY
jgi:hypothetical protein